MKKIIILKFLIKYTRRNPVIAAIQNNAILINFEINKCINNMGAPSDYCFGAKQ